MKHNLALRAMAIASLTTLVAAKGDGYYGYHLSRRGDNSSAIYETEGTTSGVRPLDEEPDVYLNASLSVGEISIEVQNLTAKVNIDAKVLNLLSFNAGVDASVDRVKLGIYNVTAKVELEARLGNVLKMVGNVLESIDLNPIIATLGDGLSDIVDELPGGDNEAGNVDDAEGIKKRDLTFRLQNNILYSINNFSGSKHRNRILAQNGSLFDVFLNNQGVERRRREVGYYERDMTFTGHNRTISDDEGEVEAFELQYLYEPFRGLSAYCNIYVDSGGKVVKTKIVAEAEGGGTATVGNVDEI